MKIAIDPNIPFIIKPLSSLPGAVLTHNLTREGVHDADIVITRTRTRCDASLLDGSKCRFIGTATIGTDHIDLDYCRRAGITVANAPGCNAPAVGQWVLSAVRETGGYEGRTLGVFGAGNVGSLLIRWALSIGMKVLVNDPPLQAADPGRYRFSTLDEIAAPGRYYHCPYAVDTFGRLSHIPSYWRRIHKHLAAASTRAQFRPRAGSRYGGSAQGI